MRISVWILGDQLLARHPALAAAEIQVGRDNVVVVLVESAARLGRMPYQRKKLVLLLSAMRHYAAARAAEGYTVDYIRAGSAVDGLRRHLAGWQPDRILTMAAAEFRGRALQTGDLAQRLGAPVEVLPNTQLLTGHFDPFPTATGRVVMENFYRAMRRRFGLLLDEAGEPAGGSWNFDKENRKPLPRSGIAVPPPLRFPPDAVTQAAMAQVAQLDGVGGVDDFDLAVTRSDALAALEDFLTHRLANFGPYEDAMSSQSGTLFHSLLSPYLNIGLLEPLEVAQAAEAAYRAGKAPLTSVEGFVRQVLGWREYIYWQYWQQMPDLKQANSWQAERPLPEFFWTAKTEMNCLRHVVERVLADGYSHHIERLMVLCNFCLLSGITPSEVSDWFMALYLDAFEWVVLPNVIGMGLNADGGRTATKPYVASGSYINRMSDYCRECRFDPRQRTGEDACPFNFLYWNFLLTHEQTLRANPRLGPAVLGLSRIEEAERGELRTAASRFLDRLSPGPASVRKGPVAR